MFGELTGSVKLEVDLAQSQVRAAALQRNEERARVD